MSFNVQIVLDDRLYLKDPEQSELGKRIIKNSIELIEELGFEKFTFRKLAKKIGTVEASIYRYFENKHRLLFYLIAWYWAWVEYQIDYSTHNVADPLKKLKIILKVIAEAYEIDPNIQHINENLLHQIVVSEASKVYLTKQVDEENRKGLFKNYSSLCRRIAAVIMEINPDYEYPVSLAGNLIETSQEQIFFSEHLPELTDLEKNKSHKSVLQFLEHIAFSALKIEDGVVDSR